MAKFNNLLGMRFGNITVIEKTKEREANGSIRWKCKCDCGRETIVGSGDLKKGYRYSCGCRGVNLVGHKFGEFTVISFVGRKNKRLLWECKCSCGNVKIYPSYKINKGEIKSCGCKRGTHRMSQSNFYKRWNAMKQRCDNPNNIEYQNYGARGIMYEERWGEFSEFKEDMYDSFVEHVKEFGEKNTSLERIDNNKGYSKRNCKWVTAIEQGNNRRVNRIVKFRGEERTLADWCRKYKLDYNITRKKYVKDLPLNEVFCVPRLYQFDIKKNRIYKLVKEIEEDLVQIEQNSF